MEGQTEFRAALKKSVVMFNLLTGKSLTEREGETFINLLDLAEGYLATSIQDGTAMMQVAVDDAGDIKVREVGQEEWRELADTSPAAVTCATHHAKDLVKLVDSALASESHIDTVANATGATTRDNRTWGIDAAWDEKPPYVAPPITTSKRDHIQGYDWQIVVLSREKDASDSYVVHFAYLPTQAQFEEHFAKFISRTHYVHVNEWHRHDKEWVSITNTKYVTHHLLKPEQEHDPRWEQDDMAYRVRYFDRETNKLTFKYMPRRPSGNELATYHSIKGFATIQSKVA